MKNYDPKLEKKKKKRAASHYLYCISQCNYVIDFYW